MIRIVSGGQTGVDQGALDAAIRLGIPHGGMCPKGRRSEAGPIPAKYRLEEHPSDKYPPRTAFNIADSDFTVILHRGKYGVGTRLTAALCKRMNKPYRVVDMRLPDMDDAFILRGLLDAVEFVNFAGPRESHDPGLQQAAADFIVALMSEENDVDQ